MIDDILKNKVLIFIGAIIVLEIGTILILIYKKFAINILQQNYPPPPKKETKKPLIIQFFICVYVTLKVTFKIVIPWGLLISLLLTVLKCFGQDIGFLESISLDNIINQVYIDIKVPCNKNSIPDPHRKCSLPVYDTNPQNDTYIKGSLTKAQLAILDKILEYEVYGRCEKGPCDMLDLNKLIIKICPNPKCKIKEFPLSQTECCSPECKYKKGKKKGQFYPLKIKISNKDICQLNRGEFKKEEENGESKFMGRD